MSIRRPEVWGKGASHGEMTVKLSPHTVSRIMKGFVAGLPQTAIAKKAGVDQSCVSIYATKFKRLAEENGILAAAREVGAFNEVQALRCLAVELYRAGLTVAEAKEGLNIMKAFLQMGVNPEQHVALIKVCREVDNPGFIRAAVKLVQIESEAGMSFHQAISSFENALAQLPALKKELAGKKAELKAVCDTLDRKKREQVNQDKRLRQREEEAKAKVAQFEHELSAEMRKMTLKKEEVQEVARLKAELRKQGLDFPILLQLGKEFIDASGKS